MIRDAKMQLLSCNFHSTVAKKEPRREGVHTVLKMQQKVVFTHYNFRYFWLQNSKISKMDIFGAKIQIGYFLVFKHCVLKSTVFSNEKCQIF